MIGMVHDVIHSFTYRCYITVHVPSMPFSFEQKEKVFFKM